MISSSRREGERTFSGLNSYSKRTRKYITKSEYINQHYIISRQVLKKKKITKRIYLLYFCVDSTVIIY